MKFDPFSTLAAIFRRSRCSSIVFLTGYSDTATTVRAIKAGAEDFLPTTGFDTVVSRAFSSLAEFVVVASNKCAQGGQMLVMKGKRPEAEIAALPEAFKVASIHRLAPPGVIGERCLVAIEAKS